MQKNTANKWVVFAYGLPDHANDGQPITGDAANITADIHIDGAAANAVDDTNPSEIGGGYYIFDITAAEANGDNLLLFPVSATSNVQVIGTPGAVWTRPPNFESLGIEADGDLTKCNLVVANTDVAALNDLSLANIFTYVIENSETFEQQLRVMRAEAAGKVSVSGNTVTFRNSADNADRIVATTDTIGQRTAVTTTLT